MKKKTVVGLSVLGAIIVIALSLALTNEETPCCIPPELLPGDESKILSDEDVRSILRDLEMINQHPETMTFDPHFEYPKIVGIYEKNNWPLKEIYFCADICPKLGYVALIFADVTSSDECRKIGGKFRAEDYPTHTIRACYPDV